MIKRFFLQKIVSGKPYFEAEVDENTYIRTMHNYGFIPGFVPFKNSLIEGVVVNKLEPKEIEEIRGRFGYVIKKREDDLLLTTDDVHVYDTRSDSFTLDSPKVEDVFSGGGGDFGGGGASDNSSNSSSDDYP